MMKKKCVLFFILTMFCLSCMTACGSEDKFNFKLNFGLGGGIGCIDTYNNTFTKDMIPNGTEIIDFNIPDDKMKEFYEAFLEYEIYDLPEDISIEPSVSPAYTYILTYTYNKQTKTIIYNNVYFGVGMNTGSSEKHDQFVKFANKIRDYVYNTEEYLNMPPAEGGYD